MEAVQFRRLLNSMIQKPIDQIAIPDLDALVALKRSEGRDLEFKSVVVGGKDADKREFLADVSSMANSVGGDLVFGIAEENGVAVSLAGLQLDDPDAEILRLESIIREGLQPRLSGLRIVWLPIASQDKAGVLLIRIPASMAAPHRVIAFNSRHFYARNSRGKYELDVHELREAFAISEGLPARLRSLHESFIQSLETNELPIDLESAPLAVLTVAPLTVLREPATLELSYKNAAPPPIAGGIEYVHTLEGLLAYSPTGAGQAGSLSLTYRSGCVSAAFSAGGIVKDEHLIWAGHVEHYVQASVRDFILKLGALGRQGPWVVFLSFRGVSSHRFYIEGSYVSRSPPLMRKSTIRLPEAIFDDFREDALVPLLRMMWFAFGIERPTDRPIGRSHH